MTALSMPRPRAGRWRRMAAALTGRRREAPVAVDAAAVGTGAVGTGAVGTDFVAAHEALDEALAGSLQAAVRQTEESTIAVMERMRGLSDRTAGLLASLDAAMLEAADKEQQVATDVALLARVADFLQDLPNRVARDMQTLDRIGAEISSLSGLAESVQAISMQSHLLSINAAIEASRAGQAGAAFKIVAQEMRTLAASSHTAAAHIGGTLTRARSVLQDGMEVNSSVAARELSDIAAQADPVRHLQTRLDGISACYRSRFEEVTAHGAALAEGTADVLGRMQFQDVLRQHVERHEAASRERAVLVAQLAASVADGPAADALAAQLAEVLDRFASEESRHGQAADGGGDAGGAPLIELF